MTCIVKLTQRQNVRFKFQMRFFAATIQLHRPTVYGMDYCSSVQTSSTYSWERMVRF